MKKDLLLLLDTVLGFVLGAVAVLMAVATIHLDINNIGSTMSEESLTEAMQEIILLIIVATYAWLAWKNAKMRPALVLVAGFFACMLLRELDYWFGLAGLHWLPPTALTAALCVFYAARKPREAVRGLARFTEAKPFAALMTGLLTVLVFSRLFGMKAIWIGLLGDDYPRQIKIFAEEGVELFGYIQCFLATAFYALLEWRKKRSYSEEAPTLLVLSEATERITS